MRWGPEPNWGKGLTGRDTCRDSEGTTGKTGWVVPVLVMLSPVTRVEAPSSRAASHPLSPPSFPIPAVVILPLTVSLSVLTSCFPSTLNVMLLLAASLPVLYLVHSCGVLLRLNTKHDSSISSSRFTPSLTLINNITVFLDPPPPHTLYLAAYHITLSSVTSNLQHIFSLSL